ncbi:MAG: hypothetical protein ACOZQL_16335 [Myxococcota bacterium]
MNRLATFACVALALTGCPQMPITDGGTGGGRGGGSGGGGGGLSPWGISDLDVDARDPTYFAIAVDPALERVGVAYFTPRGTETMMGTPDYDLKYLEWKQGSVVTPPQTIRYVQRKVGLAIAFHPSTGEPVVAYLGGAAGFVPGESIFWFQSDAVINQRSNGSTWTETVIATTGDQVSCGSLVSDRGLLVGLWPAIGFDGTGRLYLAYRDGHDGQFPQQDWGGSDVEVWEGVPPGTGKCVAAGGNNKKAYGGHVQMVMGPGEQPAIIFDQMPGTSDSNGNNVLFSKRNADGTWTQAGPVLNIGNTQTGASLAYDATEGFGIAVVDRTRDQLSYTNSADGLTWNAIQPVFGAGSGGWYPSLAMDPINHEPAIAFYNCSPRSSVSESNCTTTEDELVVSQRIAGQWRESVVDTEGGYHPKIGFFASGKRFVVYRTPNSINPDTGLKVPNAGQLKIAVER